MKRIVLCIVALLLTSGAFLSKPSGACNILSLCTAEQCQSTCIAKGAAGGACTGLCRTCACFY